MKILAIEFSAQRRSIAVVENDRVLGSAFESFTRSTRAFALVESALKAAALEPKAIDCLAIGLGPGSYTGIRAAIALAQGWQLARQANGLRLVGVSSVACLAHQAQESGHAGEVNIVVDAQRNDLYLAGYSVSRTACVETHPLRLVPVIEAQARAQAGEVILGPEATRWFPKGINLEPDAAMLGRLANKAQSFVSGEQLEPIYLREISFVKAPPPRVLSS